MLERALAALGAQRMVQLLATMETLRAQGDPIIFRRFNNRSVPRTNIDLFVQVGPHKTVVVRTTLLCLRCFGVSQPATTSSKTRSILTRRLML